MNNLIIYFSEDSDLVEAECVMKEWRGDILVSCDGALYLIDCITVNRLNKEFELAQEDDRVYSINNTVVVESVKKACIVKAIVKLVESNLITTFTTIDLRQHYSDAFPHLHDISNWKRVY